MLFKAKKKKKNEHREGIEVGGEIVFDPSLKITTGLPERFRTREEDSVNVQLYRVSENIIGVEVDIPISVDKNIVSIIIDGEDAVKLEKIDRDKIKIYSFKTLRDDEKEKGYINIDVLIGDTKVFNKRVLL